MTNWVARLRARDSRGASAVEFGLVVIPLLYIVFGIISYGFMLSFRQGISQAAAEGARAAAVKPAGVEAEERWDAAVEQINASLDYGVTCTSNETTPQGDLRREGTTVGDCWVEEVECDGSTSDAQCFRVTLDYEYADHSLLPDVGYGFVMPDNLRYVTEVQIS